MLYLFQVVFFVEQKTAYEMRIRDWRSDVCSSDLNAAARSGSGPAVCLECRVRPTGSGVPTLRSRDTSRRFLSRVRISLLSNDLPRRELIVPVRDHAESGAVQRQWSHVRVQLEPAAGLSLLLHSPRQLLHGLRLPHSR